MYVCNWFDCIYMDMNLPFCPILHCYNRKHFFFFFSNLLLMWVVLLLCFFTCMCSFNLVLTLSNNKWPGWLCLVVNALI